RSDATTRFALAHREAFRAERIHRRARRFEVETALFDFAEVREQTREEHATLGANHLQAVEELGIGEIGELHIVSLHPEFSALPSPRRSAFGDEIYREAIACPNVVQGPICGREEPFALRSAALGVRLCETRQSESTSDRYFRRRWLVRRRPNASKR